MNNCRVCGAAYIQRVGSGRRRLYCSSRCKDQAAEARRPKIAETNKTCSECGDLFSTRRRAQVCCGGQDCRAAKARRQSAESYARKRLEVRGVTCGWCGGEVLLPGASKAAKRYHPDCKAAARRAHYRRKNVLRQGVGRAISLRIGELGERDHWRCGLCGQQVVQSLSGVNPEGPTVDHILPISRGGLDEWDNVQLAHRRCNTLKGNGYE